MKKALPVLLLSLVFLWGCGAAEQAALKIGPVDVSAAEFEEAFKASRYAQMGNDGRRMFLEHYIDTKLILLEAEKLGLDKDPDFLKDIQHFWEQALLKRVVSEKNKEFADQVDVSKQEIMDYYDQYKNTDFQGKSFDDVKDQVRWVVLKIKQSQAFAAWTDELQRAADININKALLGIE